MGKTHRICYPHPIPISAAHLTLRFGRILSDDVHEEVEPHDWQCQPDHWDLERLCGQKMEQGHRPGKEKRVSPVQD